MEKFGIALGGGGARGLAHIGVLEVLEENKLIPSFVAGTSMGAVIGAMYCLAGSAGDLKKKAEKMIHSEEFEKFGLRKFYTKFGNVFERFKRELFEKIYLGELFFKRSYFRDEATKKLFFDLFGYAEFSDLKIPFVCNAVDIKSGEEVIFSEGRLLDAVRASCAIPGIFPPYVNKTRILVDGGVVNNIPVELVKRSGVDVILAVYLGGPPEPGGEFNTGFQINQRSLSIMKYQLDKRILAQADFVLNPAVANFHWADFSPFDELIRRGREVTRNHIKEIKSLFSFWHRFKKHLGISRRAKSLHYK